MMLAPKDIRRGDRIVLSPALVLKVTTDPRPCGFYTSTGKRGRAHSFRVSSGGYLVKSDDSRLNVERPS